MLRLLKQINCCGVLVSAEADRCRLFVECHEYRVSELGPLMRRWVL